MKLQYLGDAKDSFKWDYLDHLVRQLGCGWLQILPMLTEDDCSGHGNSQPHEFPAKQEILDFCRRLGHARSLSQIAKLPAITDGSYAVDLYRPENFFESDKRSNYFQGFCARSGALIFLDPDNGFEPTRSCSEKHVRFCEIDAILERAPSDAAIAVFQHGRRIAFPKDFAEIRERLYRGRATAVCWQSLMFVVVSLSQKSIASVRAINRRYAELRGIDQIH